MSEKRGRDASVKEYILRRRKPNYGENINRRRKATDEKAEGT